MDDAGRVRLGEPLGELPGIGEDPLRRNGAGLDNLSQGAPLHVLHRDEVNPFMHADFVDVHDVRVIERRRGASLELEAFDARAIFRELRAKNLDGGEAAQLRVASTVHFTHTAGTERLENLVITEATARFEHHRPSVIADHEPAGTKVQTSCLRLGPRRVHLRQSQRW